MAKITDITRQKRNKTRLNIFIDGEFVCGLDEVAALSSRIKIGDEISAEELKKLVEKSELNSAFERAVGYLSSTPRSKREIEQYLRDKNYAREIIDQTIQKLDSYHYTDDRLYAESFIRSKSKKYGSFRLQAELRKKGVSSEIISELLEGGGNDGVYNVAQKYIRSHRSCDRQKLKRFLAGRGFSWESISTAVSKLSDEGAFDTNEDSITDDDGYFD